MRYPTTDFQNPILAKVRFLKTNKPLISAVLLALLTPSSIAWAEMLPVDNSAKLTVGANATYYTRAYDADNHIGVMPQAFYDNNRWYIEGSEAGRYLYKDKTNHLRAGISYDGRWFDPDEAHGELKYLDQRQWSVLAGASYMKITPYGGFKAKVATDALGRSHGTVVTLSHLSRFKPDNWTIYPEVGVQWQDKKYNDYYFGISDEESLRTRLPTYQPKGGVSPFASISASYKINDHLSAFIYEKLEYLSDEQRESPMTDGHIEGKTRVGFNYQF